MHIPVFKLKNHNGDSHYPAFNYTTIFQQIRTKP